MTKVVSTTELRQMQGTELQREVLQKRAAIAKMSLGLAMRSEKDSAAYRRHRKELARLLTILSEKKPSPALKTVAKNATISAPKKSV